MSVGMKVPILSSAAVRPDHHLSKELDMSFISKPDLHDFLMTFVHLEPGASDSRPPVPKGTTHRETTRIQERTVAKYINEFWTSRQRQAASIHEISYRACFKPQLPRFFINYFTQAGDRVYDPFGGRGTTCIEAALLGRKPVCNDINPLSRILTQPRLTPPEPEDLKTRLEQIPMDKASEADIDLSMFYHPETESEIVSLKSWLVDRKASGREDHLDRWIRMVATNRLTGHSKGFFSVYTLPPNQATSRERQAKINEKRGQVPEYRDVKALILKKSASLLRKMTESEKRNLLAAVPDSLFLNDPADRTPGIASESVVLTVTSPPFLNVVQYNQDNWLRCWFNDLDAETIAKEITQTSSLKQWSEVMADVFDELYRITRPDGFVAFEVGEVQKKKLNLEETVIPLAVSSGFDCPGVLINQQEFTKTSNIWGVDNNRKGTNTNRVVLLWKRVS